MKTVTLLPTNKRLKQLIKEHGDQWIIVREENVVMFNNTLGILIKSLDNRHSRWVRPDQIRRNKDGSRT